VSEDITGSYHEKDFDGIRFLNYEMFVGLVACPLQFGHCEILGNILSEDLFVERRYDSKYVPFVRLSVYNRSLNEFRNNRLKLSRINVMGDMIKERCRKGGVSDLLSQKEVFESDYFLFMRTACHETIETLTRIQYLHNVWSPWSCLWLDHTSQFYPNGTESEIPRRNAPSLNTFRLISWVH
jgi:hypothetical protein